MDVCVVQATSGPELDAVRHLMRSFVAWHRERHLEDLDLIDSYFDAAKFDAELLGLPGDYSPPTGSLRLAFLDDHPAGCVALHDLGDGTCEMKRMFVPPQHRGRGVGGSLVKHIVSDARAAGFRLMRLDTSHRQDEAMRLYEKAGFRRVPAYYPVSPAMADWLVFFELSL
jgi:GNAT superfamily N-acetyltransferase